MPETAPPTSAEPMRSLHTSNFPQVLSHFGISLLVTTYQASRLVILRNDNGVLNTHFRIFPKPMGLAVQPNRLALGTEMDIREYHNVPLVARKLQPPGKHDACFLPRTAHGTGDVHIHEMAWVGDELWFANTRFSCLCTRSHNYSFQPQWRPRFITALAPDDRCHLNGLAVVDGRIKYVTALGETDTPAGWRQNKRNGGVLMDVQRNEVVARGLSMPHSPRWYAGKLDRRFAGDVQTEYKTERWPGARIKHRMKTNWLKMYDKFGLILRVETVINAPEEFSVYRTCCHHDGSTSLGWYPMTKDVMSLGHYREQALACNRRYLDALAVVDDPTPAYQKLKQLTEPKVAAGRSYAGFNPARRDDVCLFAAVLNGDHIARGFRNREVREALFGVPKPSEKPKRNSAAVGRLLKRLHMRQLIAKVPRTRRWKVTERGRRLLGLAVQLYRRSWPELAAN